MWKLCLAVTATLLPGTAMACAVMSPFTLSDLAGADIVVSGEVITFEALPDPSWAALITVRVDQVLKGEAEGEMVFVWNGGTAQSPFEDLARGGVLLRAMVPGAPPGPSFADARPDLPRLAQGICGEVWMVPADEPAMAEARALLD